MAPSPDHVAESPAPPAMDAHRSLPTPFLTKTYQIVDDPAVDDVISWNEDGSTFVVWRPAEFARDLLPKHFKHNNFSSFVRQLNTYGFRKIVPDRWEFSNDCFRRGEKHLLCDIHRRKVHPPVAVSATVPTGIPVAISTNTGASPTSSGNSSNRSAGAAPSSSGRGSGGTSSELAEENHRFRRENDQLNHELSQLKNLCNDILLLMSNYASQQQQQQRNQEDACAETAPPDRTPSPPPPSPPPPSSLLELMPLSRSSEDSEQAECAGHSRENGNKPDEEGPSPRLFGVPIGLKRARDADDGDAPADHRRAVKVKLEPTNAVTADPPRDEEDDPQWRVKGGCGGV